MNYRVHITRPLPQIAVDLLEEAGYQVTVPNDDGLPSRDELLNSVKDARGILSILTEKIDKEVLEAAPDLKVVSNMAVGYDNIDVEAATSRGVAICNTPGVLTDTTADFTWALLMAVARRVVESDNYVREGRFQWWGPRLLMGTDVYGKTLGIIGYGKIGQAVARRARGFEMEVLYSGSTAPETSEWGRKVSQEELLERSDFVSLHVPYRRSTHHLIGAEQLNRMKKSAYLINTARGPVVDENALISALKNGDIAGAGLDVFEDEPKVHPGLCELDNVVLAPHLGSATVATRERMAAMAARNLIAVLEGKEPLSVVNPAVLR